MGCYIAGQQFGNIMIIKIFSSSFFASLECTWLPPEEEKTCTSHVPTIRASERAFCEKLSQFASLQIVPYLYQSLGNEVDVTKGEIVLIIQYSQSIIEVVSSKCPV